MKVYPLTMSFKGSRDYLQGADIFNALTQTLTAALPSDEQGATEVFLAIHALAHRQCDLQLREYGDDPQARPQEPLVAQFGMVCRGQEVRAWLTESERPVSSRLPYREEEIAAATALRGKAIVYVGESRYTPAEVLVAMTKLLHSALLPLPAGRWILSKLELAALPLPPAVDGLQIELLHNLNNRLTKSAITRKGTTLGQIFFSQVPA